MDVGAARAATGEEWSPVTLWMMWVGGVGGWTLCWMDRILRVAAPVTRSGASAEMRMSRVRRIGGGMRVIGWVLVNRGYALVRGVGGRCRGP